MKYLELAKLSFLAREFEKDRTALEKKIDEAWSFDGAIGLLSDAKKGYSGNLAKLVDFQAEYSDMLYSQSLDDVDEWEEIRLSGTRKIESAFGRSFDKNRVLDFKDGVTYNLGNRFYRINEGKEKSNLTLVLPELRRYGEQEKTAVEKLLLGEFDSNTSGNYLIGLSALGFLGLVTFASIFPETYNLASDVNSFKFAMQALNGLGLFASSSSLYFGLKLKGIDVDLWQLKITRNKEDK